MKTKLLGLALLRNVSLFLQVIAAVLFAAQESSAEGTWTALSRNAPGEVSLMLLLPDGSIMAANPYDSDEWYRLAPDSTGHYVNGTWTSRAIANYTRLFFSSQVLQDGRVFVAGGEYGTGGDTAERYDPVTDTWTTLTVPAGLINSCGGATAHCGFSDSCSVMLPDGNVLIAPVYPATANHTVIYNPSANSWSDGPASLGDQNEASWVKLPDDSILTVDKSSTSSERFIPSLNTWVQDATLPENIYGVGSELGAAFLLPDGRAFFMGGTNRTALYTPSPLGGTNSGTWASGPEIPGNRGAPDAGACMMPNGKILCAFSPFATSTNNVFPKPVSFYEYDYTVGTVGEFTRVDGPTGATDDIVSYKAFMLALPDGNVLYSDYDNQLYVYEPDGSPLAAGKPSITGISQNSDGSFHLRGTGLNGISQGASYGDDAQMDSNYPLVRVASDGTTTYLRTFNWSSTSVATGDNELSTEFVATNLWPGEYSLKVVANGIASDSQTFFGPVWVDFNYAAPLESQWGTYHQPYNTLTRGVNNVAVGGTISIKSSSSSETMTISKRMTISAVGGSAIIGR